MPASLRRQPLVLPLLLSVALHGASLALSGAVPGGSSARPVLQVSWAASVGATPETPLPGASDRFSPAGSKADGAVDAGHPANEEAGPVEPSGKASEAPPPAFYPASALAVAPVAIGRIDIGRPNELPRVGRFVGVFTVLIDVSGAVLDVVADAPTLTPPMAAATRDAFLQARFSPGLRAGLPVRSAIRIEVVFEYAGDPGVAADELKQPVVVSHTLL